MGVMVKGSHTFDCIYSIVRYITQNIPLSSAKASLWVEREKNKAEMQK